MISDLLGTDNLINAEVNDEYNSFRPMFQHFYNESFANTYVKIQTQDENGEPIIKYYDLDQNPFIEFADE